MVQQQSYKYFSIELSIILLNVYDSLENLGTMGATSRTGILHLLYINLYCKKSGYKIYTTILKNHTQKTLDAMVGENQSAAVKNNIKHIFHHSRCNCCLT